VPLKSNTQKRVIRLLAIAISVCTLALIGTQLLWIKATAKTEEENFTRNVQYALQLVVHEIDQHESSLLLSLGFMPHAFRSDEQRERLQALVAYFSADGYAIEKRISKQQVDTLLRMALRRVKIFSPYEFAVTSDVGTIIFETDGFHQAEPEECAVIALFPDVSNELSNAYLNVFIPRKTEYVLHAMRWMIVVSTMLTLIITATFVTTLVIIFRQKKLSKIKTDFVGNITHELKTPIGTISLAAQMLQDPDTSNSSENRLRLSSMIQDESQRLLQLVESVLRSAVGDNEKIKFRPTDIDLHELISKVLARFALQFTTLQATCTMQLNAAKTHVLVDDLHIANVLSNLVDNAIKYRRADVPLELTIKTENSEQYIVVSIIDNGIGLAGHNIKQLFEQFYRKPVENMHTVKGFGLGLYYSKNIIESHNGTLLASNNNDSHGSTFTFKLPVYSEIC